MKFKVLSCVVHFVIHNDPTVFFGVVLLDLLHGVDLLLTILCWCGRGLLLLGIALQVEELSESSRFRLICDSGHPTALQLTGLSGLFEAENMFPTRILFHVHLEAEYLIVSHTHQVPCGTVGLAHVGFVPSPAPDFLATYKVRDLELIIPPTPAPVHSIFCRLFLSVQRGEFPVDSSIGTDFNTGDHAAASSVSIARNIVSLVNVLSNRKLFIVQRRGDSRVDVELIEDVLWFVPPATLEGLLSGDVRREDTIVMVVVMVLSLVRDDINLLEPFDHAATNVSWNDETDRVSMIGH
mmetsp:Transcript_6702/g.10471  ORF Transcript_6702/g.10471 Transcript_6702/m.10471 type:complete len:295 (+) Transcript_6702:507-1391(+)